MLVRQRSKTKLRKARTGHSLEREVLMIEETYAVAAGHIDGRLTIEIVQAFNIRDAMLQHSGICDTELPYGDLESLKEFMFDSDCLVDVVKLGDAK